MAIELSVGLPLFRAGRIAWLTLQSLARQKDIDFEWELIVAEELEPDAFGLKRIEGYRKRLEKVGCVRCKYIPVKHWIALSKKWHLLANNAAETSEVFIVCSADEYSQPRRLAETHDLVTRFGADWVHTPKGLMYDLATDRTIMYNGESREMYDTWLGKNLERMPIDRRPLTHLSMGTRTEYMREIPLINYPSGVDGWLAYTIENMLDRHLYPTKNLSKGWKNALQVHGINNISVRAHRFDEVSLPFERTTMKIEDAVPKPIVTRLRKARKDVYDEQIRINRGWRPDVQAADSQPE